MVKYKTCVTDYEGMQSVLDTHAAQGWRLFSINPDTWRKSVSSMEESDTTPFEGLSGGSGGQEYSASYYLIVFERDEYQDEGELASTAEKEIPRFYEE